MGAYVKKSSAERQLAEGGAQDKRNLDNVDNGEGP